MLLKVNNVPLIPPAFSLTCLLKMVPDVASLRHEFRVSTGRKAILWRKMHAKWRNGGFLIDFLGFLPVETRNSCLSEASIVWHNLNFLSSFHSAYWIFQGYARRGLSEARLTEARFTEATCGISCARFRALVRPKRAQASLKQERTSAGQEFFENYMIFGI